MDAVRQLAGASSSCDAFNIVPYMRRPITNRQELPELPGDLIQGVMRKGDKLMLVGASKSGKTCNLLSLATCIAVGGQWCGMACAEGSVLFVNLEVRDDVFMHRLFEICQCIGADSGTVRHNLMVCNLRGKFSEIGKLVDSLLEATKRGEYDVIIIDPAYKVQDGIENNADAIARFCAELDKLAEESGCSVIYSHHHSKGYQAWKDAEDRASGSGVFARDADAIIDLIELASDSDSSHGIPFRMEFVLRGFPEHDPVNVWFEYPCHRVDRTGTLEKRSARKPGNLVNARSVERARELAAFEEDLDAFMGAENSVNRKEYERHSNLKRKKLVQLLESSKRFENVSSANQAEIRRKPQP